MLTLVRQAFEGRYEVEREIGKGGNARIFLAREPGGQPVALKILHPELLVSVAADRFLREIKLASQLDHPHIAHLLDSGERDWLVYYVMTYVEGATLREFVAQRGRLSVSDALRVADDLLDALEHAHAHGIIHRDVKPENVVISPQGAVLLDFGIARAVWASGERPAHALGHRGRHVDLHEPGADHRPAGDRPPERPLLAGCVLFECLAGQPPFVHRNEAVVLQMHLTQPAPDLRTLRPEIPAKLAAGSAGRWPRRRRTGGRRRPRCGTRWPRSWWGRQPSICWPEALHPSLLHALPPSPEAVP